LSGRLNDLSNKYIESVPGPGTYQTIDLLNKNLKANVSRFPSPSSAKFGKSDRKN
jgi:hypothetical protein